MHPSFSALCRSLPAAIGLALFASASAAFVVGALAVRYGSELAGATDQAAALGPGTLDRASEVFDRSGAKIGEFAGERRYYVPLATLPPHVIQAFLSAEDQGFYGHYGVSPTAVVRAALVNLRRGGIRQGASTITQQLARHLFLDPSRNFERKIKEVLLALAMERRLGKERILELYLNTIYLGNRSYGVEAAARNYFRKGAPELTVAEAALLAALPKAPSYYAPHRHPKRASARQAFVLHRMVEAGYLTRVEARAWKRRVVHVARGPEDHYGHAPHFVAAVRAELERKLELERIPQHGLHVATTLDAPMQRAAQAALARLAKELAARSQTPGGARFDGAVIALDAASGAVRVLVGGASFAASQFNRALQARRRVGGLIAPLLASLALERGYTLATPVGADPMTGGRDALASSRQGPSLYDAVLGGEVHEMARLFALLGGGSITEHARRLGLPFARDDAAVALGYGEAAPVDVAIMTAAFANGGKQVAPYLVGDVDDPRGTRLYAGGRPRASERVLSEASAFIMRHLFADRGRQHGAAYPRTTGAMPAAAGVACSATDDLHDAWCAGFAGRLAIVTWIGSETGRARLGSDAEAALAPVYRLWRDTVAASAGDHGTPLAAAPPKGVIHVAIGQRALPFIAGTEPRAVQPQRR